MCIVALFFLPACEDDGPTEPRIDPPFDFRLTDFEAAWSPDGNTIVYVHGDTVSGKTGIYLINPDGTNKRLWYASAGAYVPSWSPDGQWITFYDSAQIYKRKLNGDSLTQLTFEGRNFFPAWSPDGVWIAYDRTTPVDSSGIWIMNLFGESKIKVADGRFPDWHPDGSHIIFIGFHGEIYRLNLNDSVIVRLTSLNQQDIYATTNHHPKYSPDGTKIAFTSQPNGDSPQIWVMNSDGTNPKQLTDTQGYSCDWSPDGQWIVYTDSRAVSGRLWIMRNDGSDKRQLTFD